MPCDQTVKNLKVCKDVKVKGDLTVDGKSTLGETKVTKDLTVQGTTNVKAVLTNGDIGVNGKVTATGGVFSDNGNIKTAHGFVNQGVETKTLTANGLMNIDPNLTSGITVIDCTVANYTGAKGTLLGSNATISDGQPKQILVVNAPNVASYTLKVLSIEGGGGAPIDFQFGVAFGNMPANSRNRSLSLVWSSAANSGNGAWVNSDPF